MQNAQVLVKGYLEQNVTSEHIMERMYAVYPDGTVKRSQWARVSQEFARMRNGHARTWEVIDVLPDNVEFCGNYYL